VAVLAGGVGGGFALVVECRRIGAVVQEQAGELEIAVLGGFVQRRHTGLLARVDIGTGVNQKPGDARLRPGERGVQSGHVELMARMRIDLGTAHQKQLDRLAAAKECRQAERLEAVWRPGVDRLWIGVGELGDTRDGVHRGRLVDRQGRRASRGQQLLGVSNPTVIQRVQDGRDDVRHGRRCYHGPPMIFVDYLGPIQRLAQVSDVVRREVGAAMRMRPDQVAVRRIVTDDDRDEVELWVELSTDEQLYRLGRQLAQGISAGLRPDGDGPQVWVMYRVVPLSNAFLNGEARGRGTATFE
jgi:hypothetical protein